MHHRLRSPHNRDFPAEQKCCLNNQPRRVAYCKQVQRSSLQVRSALSNLLLLTDHAGRYSVGNAVVRNVTNDHGTCPDKAISSDGNPIADNCSDTDKTAIADPDTTTQCDPRGEL